MMTAHPTEDLAAFSIAALDPDEQKRVAAHVAGCDRCRAEVNGYVDATWALAVQSAREAPRELGSLIVDRARRDSAGQRPAAVPPPTRAARNTPLLLRPVPIFLPAALAAAFVLAVAGLVIARADAQRLAAIVDDVVDARVVSLAPSADLPEARGVLVLPTRGSAYLVLDLPAPPAGKAWVAWVLRGTSEPTAAGLTTEHAHATVTLSTAVSTGDAVAVTLESAQGATRPTTSPVLTGRS